MASVCLCGLVADHATIVPVWSCVIAERKETQMRLIRSEIFIVAAAWMIGGAIGQLLALPFGMASSRIWFGLVIGATSQSIFHYYYPHRIWRKANE